MNIFKSWKYLKAIQSYILSLTIFYSIIIYVPYFSSKFILPKLLTIQVGSIILIGLEIIHIFLVKKKLTLSNYLKLLLFLLFINIISFLHSQIPVVSFWGNEIINNYGLYSIFFFVIISYIYYQFDGNQKNLVKSSIVAGTLLTSIHAIISYYFLSSNLRPNGLEGQPIWTSGIVGVGLLLIGSTNFGFISPHLNNFNVKLLITLIYIWSLKLLDSNTTWLTLLFTCAVVLILFVAKQKIKKQLKFAAIIIAFALVSIFTYFAYKHEAYSVPKRIIELQGTINMIKNELVYQPMSLIIGKGQATSGFYFKQYRSPNDNQNKDWYWTPRTIYSHYLEILFATGIIGLLSWLLIIFSNFKDRLKNKGVIELAVPIYLATWQFIYLLLPNMLLFCFLFFGEYKQNKPKLKPVNKIYTSLLLIAFLIICIYEFIFIARTIAAEHYHWQNKYEKAYIIGVSKDTYTETHLRKLVDGIAECTRPNSKKLTQCKNVNSQINTAIEVMNISKNINPIDPVIWSLGGQIYFFKHLIQNPEDEAVKVALSMQNKALQLNPSSPTENENLGLIYLEIKQFDKAEHYLLKANQLLPNNSMTIKHLIELYKQMGNSQKEDEFNRQLLFSYPINCSQTGFDNFIRK